MSQQAKFLQYLNRLGSNEGINLTRHEKLIVIRESDAHARIRTVYEPFLVAVGQGKKYCYVGEQRYKYDAGMGLMVLLPMPVQTEIVGVTPDNPFLAAVLALDLDRLAEMLLKIERVERFPPMSTAEESSGIYSFRLTDAVIHPMLRLFDALQSVRETAVLSDLIIEEIHYRLLCHENGVMLRNLLHQRGKIQRITQAVEYIHQNLDKPVSVESLAEMVHMSRAAFYQHFKLVMHLSPLQYAKSMKLFEAQKFILEGKNAGEAGYLVGYNSPAQFSREYKRHFGYAPSATVR